MSYTTTPESDQSFTIKEEEEEEEEEEAAPCKPLF